MLASLFLALFFAPLVMWIIDGAGLSRLQRWKWTLVLWELGVGVLFLCVLFIRHLLTEIAVGIQ
jgi:hypothetical protein